MTSMWKLVALVVLFGSRPDGLEPTDRLAPPGWVGNPWGPAVTKAREAGTLPPLPVTAEMARWDAWGKKNLRDGDILFRRGDARLLGGFFPFSRFIANVSGSAFSHTGIVAIEDGQAVLYDTTKASVRRQPIGVWVLDNVGPMGVKRLKPGYRDRIAKILDFCRQLYKRQVPFDFDLGLGDDELYCVEMTEKAYRSVGLKLSDPVRLGEMENAEKFPLCMFGFSTFSNLRLDQAVYFPGNERHGIWSSPLLETIYAPSTVVAGRQSQIPGEGDQKAATPEQ
jgi:hypothetical protein